MSVAIKELFESENLPVQTNDLGESKTILENEKLSLEIRNLKWGWLKTIFLILAAFLPSLYIWYDHKLSNAMADLSKTEKLLETKNAELESMKGQIDSLSKQMDSSAATNKLILTAKQQQIWDLTNKSTFLGDSIEMKKIQIKKLGDSMDNLRLIMDGRIYNARNLQKEEQHQLVLNLQKTQFELADCKMAKEKLEAEIKKLNEKN
jgi:hypothetical protein